MNKKDIYLLVGIGMGIIITSIIFYITLILSPQNNTSENYTRDEIILQAIELGMVFPDENNTTNTEDENVVNNDELNVSDFIVNTEENENSDDITEIDDEVTENEEVTENNEVQINDEDDTQTNSDTTDVTNEVVTDTDNQEVAEETQDNNTEEVVENISFIIKPGMTSNAVSEILFNLGLVDNSDKFNKFLVSNKLDRIIRPKKYNVPSNSTESEIIYLITGKKVEYN